jgi:hypothetical protein
MNIPLERLYHYVSDIAGPDVIIYRWSSHGSKILYDLRALTDILSGSQLQFYSSDLVQHVAIIAHDQEPLDLLYYDRQHICEHFARIFGLDPQTLLQDGSTADIKDIVYLHLRSVLHPSVHRPILLHSEVGGRQLKIYQQLGYIPAYWWCHAVLARDWFRYAQCDPQLKHRPAQWHKDFLIYCRSWTGTRKYRLAFFEMLADEQLSDYCQASLASHDQGFHYLDIGVRDPDLAVQRTDLDQIFRSSGMGPAASADYDNQDYAAAALEIVLETVFDDDRQHLTEKTLRPIACGKPFLLAATPYSLRYLRSYGFLTFAPLIDESYDEITDTKQRLRALVKEMRRIANLSRQQKQILYQELHQRAQINQKHFFSEDFYQQVTQELSCNVKTAVEQSRSQVSLAWIEQRLRVANRWNDLGLSECQSLYAWTVANIQVSRSGTDTNPSH